MDFSFISKDYLAEKYEFINNVRTTSIHVRRGDYVNHWLHHIDLRNYYNFCFKQFENVHYYICSDDIEWCKNNLLFDNILFVEGLDDIEDMWLMSLCKNNIIANSTFSWWGAWLNKNPDKKVISPNNWFGNHVNINQNNIIPENWIKI